MAFLATNLVQNILTELGQVPPVVGLFDATNGSATTFVNSAFGDSENPPEQDVFKNYLAIVVRDAGGASASPEGRWGVVSAYNDTTYTGTIASVTDAIASGDKIMLAKQDKFPLSQIMTAINQGLESLGDLPSNADESLTTISGQEVYNVPVAAKRGLKQVWIELTDDVWTEVTDKRNELTGAGTASKLYLPSTVAGRTVKLIYDGPHAVVSAYNSPINEYVHPSIATCAAILKLLEWYNRLDENQDEDSYFLWLENKYRTEYLPAAKGETPIQEEVKTAKFFSLGRHKDKYRYGWKPQ